jgi:hypothetical protein
MALHVSRCAHWAAHGMPRDNGPGKPHGFGDVPEGPNHDGHGGDPFCFHRPSDVSDRHVTDGSDRDQESYICARLTNRLHPLGQYLEKPVLIRHSREGECVRNQLTNTARCHCLRKAVPGER